MSVNIEAFKTIGEELKKSNVELVAVSKTKPIEDIQALYALGQRNFGENYVQELVDKQTALSSDIQWHFIGHLQTNKVKYIAPFVHLIHGVDSEKLLAEINKQAIKNNRVIPCLLQIHIATEETKFGFDAPSLQEFVTSGNMAQYSNVIIKGLMGMASFTEDSTLIAKEFSTLKTIFDQTAAFVQSNHFNILSMGMSSDYSIAIEKGSNLVRIGSLLFGARN